MQWVALTSEKYFDDDKHYKVTNHDMCIDKLEEMTADKPTDDDSSTWKSLHFIIEDTGSLGITVEVNPKNKGIYITGVISSSTASKSGFKVGYILCKLRSKGTRFVKKVNETIIQNVMSH